MLAYALKINFSKIYELCKLYELCYLYECLMNHLKSLEIAQKITVLNIIFLFSKVFQNFFVNN